MADEKNKGGILGGLGYVGAGLAAGVGSVGEGIIDLLLAGGGLLTGNVDYAKHVFKDNTVGNWFADVTEDFNPGTGWEFAGNVTHGLGQSSVFLLNLIPGLGQLGTAAFFAGVGSQGISSAAATTGDVGFKEVAYGVASGAVEGALEKAFGGMGKAVKALGGSTMKNITKTAVRKGLVKQVLSDAAGEFGEEFASEYIDTFLQRGFQIDPNKQYSFKDALYAGAVGFTSGAVSAGSANVLKAIGNERVGDRIVKSGNSQTLVNTATKVADKLAAQGTNWDRAGEWVKALRGQVDAYSKLSESGKTGMRGKTILGEMKSSLFFAETQSTFDLVKKSIQDSDEQTRATFAEYINRSVEKGKRNGKDYTAADIAKDTDGVAWQLAIYKFVPSLFDIDGALADIEQEQAIADFVAEKQGAMKRDVVDTEIASAAAGAPAMETTQIANGENVTVPGAVEGARLATVGSEKFDIDHELLEFYRDVSNMKDRKAISKRKKNLGYISESHANLISDAIYKETGKKFDLSGYELWIDGSAIQHIQERHGENGAADQSMRDENDVSRITWVANNAENAEVLHRSDGSVDVDYRYKNRDQSPSVKVRLSAPIDDTTFYVVECVPDSENKRLHVESAYIEQNGSIGQELNIDSKKSPQQTSETHLDGNATNSSITQPEGKVNPETKENVSKGATDEKGENLRSEAVEVEGEQTGANNVESASATAEATAEVAKSVDGEVDLEKAKRDAERMIAWEKKSAPTTSELNTLRDYVNDFDYLPKDRQMAILRMVRSSNGVDQKTVKGVANLMAITNKKGQVLAPDLEFRFADGLGDKRGIKVSIGDKTLALLNSDADHKDTIRGSIVHEIVHYLENRKGYKALAEYARKIAKPELVEKIKKNYGNYYAAKYAKEERASDPKASLDEITKRVRERMQTEEFEALIDSEITAKVVGNALNSEKFLKRYAQVGEEKGILKTAARFIKGIFNSTKDKDADLSREAQNLAGLFDRALASEVEGEQKSGEKYSFSSIGYSFFGRDDVTIEEFESGAYKKTEGYKAYVAECLSNMRQSRADFNEASAKREIERSIDGIVRVAIAAKNAGYDIYDSAAQRTTKDSKKRLLFSSLEPNSDYFTSSDISTICDKRKNFTEIENEINRIEAERNVPREKRFFADINNFFVLHDILARHGLTTACRQCYVESMRKNLGRMANAFITLVTEENAENKKNAQLYNKNGEIKSGNADLRVKVRELMAEEGIDANYLTFERLTNGENLAEMRLQYPLLYEAYNSFYGQSKPKMPKSATPFRFGELTALLTDDNGKINERLVRQIESTGGFRLQSYSDFQIKNYVDVLQVIFEAGTLGLTGHAYTKVPAFLDATANTNLKRNISIFMYRDGDEWKIDRKDSFPYALDKIYDIVDADKSGDTGIIAVSQNDDMSAWIMANDQIAYGIPFHKSGTKMGVVRETVVYEGKREIKGYTGIKDHTRMQSEVYASGADKGKKVKSPINIYSFWDFDSTRMSKKNLIEKNLKAYIDACEEKGYLPKFRDYVMNNEKVLNSTLEYAKKLGAVGTDATVADISFKYKGYTIPYGYYKFLGDFSMFTPDGKASAHEVLSLKNYDFDAAVNFFSDSKKLRINELLQQLDNGPEREKYRKLIDEGKMTITELGQVIKKKRDAVVAEVVDKGEKNVKPSDEKYDLDPEIEAEIEAETNRLDTKKDVHGREVSDDAFRAAIRRGLEERVRKAENTAEAFKEGNKTLSARLEETRELYQGAIDTVSELELELRRVENSKEAFSEGLKNKDAYVKELRAKYRDALDQIMEMKDDIRNLEIALEGEQRRVERLKKQNENQRKQVRDSQKEQWKIVRQNAELINHKKYTISECEKFLSPELIAKHISSKAKDGIVQISKEQIKEIARKLATDLNYAFNDTGKLAVKAANDAAISLVSNTLIENPYYDPDDKNSKEKISVRELYGDALTDLVQKDIFEGFANIGHLVNPKKHNADQKKIDKLKEKLRETQSELAKTNRQYEMELRMEIEERERLSEKFAAERTEISKVFKPAQIKTLIKAMVEEGRVADFFAGHYKLNLPPDKLNAIVRYIALQLNTLGTTENREAAALIKTAARDIANQMKFEDEESGKTVYLKDISEEEVKNFTGTIRYELQNIFSHIGTLNEYGELMRGFEVVKAKHTEEKKKSKEEQAWGKEFPKTYQEALKMRHFAQTKKGIGSDSVQDVTKALAGLVDESGHLHYGMVDEAMKKASTFFAGEALKLQSERGNMSDDAKITDDALVWTFNPELQEMVEYFIQLRQGREGKPLTSEELSIVSNVLRGMRTTLERYNKEYVNGKWVDVDIAAGETVLDMTRKTKSKTLVSKFLNTKVGKFINDVYFYEVLSPETVIESLEDFKTAGLLKTMYHDIRTSKQKAITRAARMKDPFKQFLDNDENNWKDEKGHKHSYTDKLNKKEIEVYGKKINLGEALYLYMLTRREQARLGLEETGYITYDDKGKEKTRVRLEDVDLARNQLISQFDETDKAFLKLAEQFFNETASKVKYDADMKIFGYSNNVGGYYVPIIRDRYSRMNGVTDMRQSASSIVTVYNKSFTKNVVRNNKALEGQNIMRIINDHADGLADYAELYLPLKAFDRIYNHGITTEEGNTSIRQMLNTQKWNGTEKYLKKLFADIQGQPTGEIGNIDRAVAWVRSGWVNSVLGANLKVVATQTTSLGAATQIIDAKYVTKASWIITPGTGFADGVKAIADRADKYSDIIFARHFDMGALKAQGNIDKVTDLGKKTGSMIEWMDRKVCVSIFHAAEYQIEAQTGHKIGTEENAVLAAKLADEAIYATQSMDSQAEKSALQRERSEIAKLFSMFTSDTVKNLSHLWGNFMKWDAHRNRAKNGEAGYTAELKKDGKALRRSMRTMLITGVMIGLISQGFKYLYGKEEEEPEDKQNDFYIDMASSTLNVFPIVSEFIDKIFLDYDLSINVLDVANDTLDAVGVGFEVMGDAMSGEYVSDQKIVKTSANILKSGASLFGLPINPIERTVSGILRGFFPSAVYGYDAMMYSPAYSADLKAAVESGDDALAEHILETIYKNEATGVYSTPELEEVARLYGLGNTSVIPQKIGATVNDVKLDRKQRAQFEKIYSEASAKVNELIRSEYYAELDDEQRAKAIKTLYSLYYNRAAAEVAGVEWSNAQAYSRLTDNYAALFAAQSYKSGLSPYKTLRGKEVSVKDQFVKYVENLGLNEADKLVVLYANGYRDAATKKKMLAYINSLSISEEEKTRIAERLGFALENGKVVEKKEELEVRAE